MHIRLQLLSLLLLAFVCTTFVVYADPDLAKRAPQVDGGGQPPASPPAPAPSSSNPPPAASPPAASPPAASPAPPSSGAPAAPSGGLNTAPASNQSVPASGMPSNSLAGLPTSGNFGNTIYPGAASFVKPTGSKSVSPLFRIDSRENVTFVWQFESLMVRPVNLTLAAVGPQSATYTIAQMDGMATSAVWALSSVPQATPLFNGMYQIQLYDQRGLSAPPQPGWLMANTRLTIAFYNPETYAPGGGSDYCPTCFYAGAQRTGHSFGGLAVGFGIACVTSAAFIYGLLN